MVAMADACRALRLLLRVVGSVSLTALVFVMVPYSWMNDIHGWLGLGALPPEPVVGYLARSASALYALTGGLLWVLSFDLGRNRLAIGYLGYAFIAFGVVLTFVDWLEGMPLFWKLGEGPIVIAFGLVMSILVRRLEEGGVETG